MPRMDDGSIVRARYTSLKLNELSSVDRPAQVGARAIILKRDDSPTPPAGSGLARAIAKYVGSDDGAHTFQEVLSENKFSEAIWPMTDALSQSIRSIVGDETLNAAARDAKITTTVDEFLAAVRQLDPPTDGSESDGEQVEKQLRELISKKEPTMKTVEQLQTEIETLKGQVTTATGEATAAKSALETEQAAHGVTKTALAAATDETFKAADGTEVKKSDLGAAAFAVLKASEERAQVAVFEKRAGEEFGHLPGTSVEKGVVLKHIEQLPDDAKKAALAILTSAEKMAAGGFSRLGGTGVEPASVAKARSDFEGKVAEIKKRDDISEFDAMRKARTEHPDLFEAYQGAEAAAA